MVIKSVELTDEEIDLVIITLANRIKDLDAVLKDTTGLEAETVRDHLIEKRDLNSLIRELVHYVIAKEK